jgi:hypothetical protein
MKEGKLYVSVVCPFCISVIKMYIFLIPIDFISIAICIYHIYIYHTFSTDMFPTLFTYFIKSFPLVLQQIQCQYEEDSSLILQ